MVDQTATAFLGTGVEVADHWFIEGAWNGPFSEARFSETDCIFGSGAVASATDIVFVSSAATTDYLFYCRDAERVWVANSLPCLLAAIRDRLDPQCDHYDQINESITWGIQDYIKTIPTQRGSVFRLMYRNLIVSARDVTEVEKRLPPRFDNFAAYREYLAANLDLVIRNARDPKRATPMQVFSTQSKGYDSTAINALASRSGIDMVFTVRQGKGRAAFAERDRANEVDDDGTQICEALKLPCSSIERRAFEREFDDEYLFYAGLDANGDFNLKGIFRNVDRVALVLTGCLGEAWYSRKTYARNWPGRKACKTSDLARADLGNHGLSEVRLAVGFVQVAPIYIGIRSGESIFDITDSPEMDPWRLGIAYDRPIPRRIAEEAGVPRSLFGQRKMASVVEFALPRAPRGMALRKEYFEYLADHKLVPRWLSRYWPMVHKVNSAFYFSGPRHNRALYYLDRAVTKLTGHPLPSPLIWRRMNGRIFCYCVNRRAEEYRNLLDTNSDERGSDG